ncbi:MAG: hypothetical protein ACI9LM_000108 [Alteromonadaceae bacterium]|jgi:hypothetical protein
MLPNPLSVANSGSMPIKFGDATSGNGDQVFDARASFAGIGGYNKGVPPWLVVGGAIAFGLLFIFARKNA